MGFLTLVQYEDIIREVEGLHTLRIRIQRGFSKVLEATPGVLRFGWERSHDCKSACPIWHLQRLVQV
jgi:hypothetical protein